MPVNDIHDSETDSAESRSDLAMSDDDQERIPSDAKYRLSKMNSPEVYDENMTESKRLIKTVNEQLEKDIM